MDKKKIFEIVGISCAGFGLLLTFIFGAVSCSRSAYNAVHGSYSGSLWYIGVVVALLIVITGIVFAILSMTKGEKPSILVIITLALAVTALLFGILPHITICAYNCSLKSSVASYWR